MLICSSNKIKSQEVFDLDAYFQELTLEELDVAVLENYRIQLEDFLQTGIDLNKVTEEELSGLLFLSPAQVRSFVQYREALGPFLSIYELQAVPGFDQNTIELMRPFLESVKTKKRYSSSIAQHVKKEYFTQEISVSWDRYLETARGYKPNSSGSTPYRGDPNRLYIRYLGRYNRKLSFGVNVEKDPGETLFKDQSSLGFDHLSFFINAQEISPSIRQIHLGDYYLNLGQGLIHYGGFNPVKTPIIDNVVKREARIRPFRARSESIYLRGVAVDLRLTDKVELSPFVSHRKRSANLIDAPDPYSDSLAFSSIKEDGLHRTEAEIADKNSVQHTIYGASLSYTENKIKLALNHISHRFNIPFEPRDRPDNAFDFRGKSLQNTSLSYKWHSPKVLLYGETAISDGSAWATLNGLNFTPSDRLDLILQQRSISPMYNSIGAAAFTENSTPNNEIGWYWGVRYKLSPTWTLSGFIDIYHHPWQRFRISAPTQGKEYLLRAEYYKKRKWNAHIQYNRKTEEDEFSVETQSLTVIDDSRLGSLRLHANLKFWRDWELRSRFEWKHYSDPNKRSQGWLYFQDFIYRPLERSLSVMTRLSYFDVDDFDARIYAYENDLIYQFSIPFFYGKGLRSYINLRWKKSDWTLEARYDLTHYLEDFDIGSGLNQTSGRTRSRLKAQVILRL